MPDRYGEPAEQPSCRDPRCRKGWLTAANADHPEPCPTCKPHLCGTTATTNDFAERIPSARAQQAIDAADAAESENR